MRTLRLVALSDDGQSLILSADGADADGGERFEIPIDDRLRAAARGDSRRLTQIDVDLGTELPPAGDPGPHPRRRDPRAGRRRLGHPRRADHALRLPRAAGARPRRRAGPRRARPAERGPAHRHPVGVRRRAAAADRRRRRRGQLGRPPRPRRLLADHRRLAGRREVGDDALDLRPPVAHRRPGGRGHHWTSPRAPVSSGSSRRCRPACTAAPSPRSRSVSVVRDTAPDAARRRTTTSTASRPTPCPPTRCRIEKLAFDGRARRARPGRPRADRLPGRRPPAGRPARRGRRPRHRGPGPHRRGAEDPRARIPAWEDIVFGVRRHR